MTNYTLQEFKFLLQRCVSLHIQISEDETIEIPKGKTLRQLKEIWQFSFGIAQNRVIIGVGEHSSGQMYTNKVKENKDRKLESFLEIYKNAMKTEKHHRKSGNVVLSQQALTVANDALAKFKKEIEND